MCEAAAEEILSSAPSSITVQGLTCHPYANGLYLLDERTIGAKRAWHLAGGDREVHLFFREDPVKGEMWCIGDNTETHFASIRTYEPLPPWQQSRWDEECGGGAVGSDITLDPGYSSDDCAQFLQLVQEEVHPSEGFDREGLAWDGMLGLAPPHQKHRVFERSDLSRSALRAAPGIVFPDDYIPIRAWTYIASGGH